MYVLDTNTLIYFFKGMGNVSRHLLKVPPRDAVNIFPFGYKEAGYAATIRVKLEKKGLVIGPYDILIAAVALSKKGILVTHNIAEFERVAGLELIDWY